MKIGIKYCGGCNSKYDRIEFVNKIINIYSEINFEPVMEQVYYDYILIINGCRCACAGHQMLNTSI